MIRSPMEMRCPDLRLDDLRERLERRTQSRGGVLG